MTRNTKIVVVLVILALIAVVFYYLPSINKGDDLSQKEITSFEECVAAGNPVMESYPRQCNAQGRNFVEKI